MACAVGLLSPERVLDLGDLFVDAVWMCSAPLSDICHGLTQGALCVGNAFPLDVAQRV